MSAEHAMFSPGVPLIEEYCRVKNSRTYFELLEYAEFFEDQCADLTGAYAWSSARHFHTHPVRSWSRVYEYPFIVEKLRHVVDEDVETIVDLGCGFTFFPFYVAQLFPQVQVFAYDIDQENVALINTAAFRLGMLNLQGEVHDLRSVANTSGQVFDVAYSISVLEHIPEPIGVPEQISAILKPGASCFITLDLSRDKKSSIFTDHVTGLLECFHEEFMVTDSSKVMRMIEASCVDEANIGNLQKRGLARGPWKNKYLSYIKCCLYNNRKYFVDESTTFACLDLIKRT